MKIRNTVIIAAMLLSLVVVAAPARPVVGAASVSIFGPVPKDVADKARAEAVVNFRDELQMWLRENMRVDIDTANTIKKFALKKFAERCLKDVEEKTATRGRIWTLTLSLSEDAVRSALRAHNDLYNSQAVSKFGSARSEDPSSALSAAVGALCAAMARIEPSDAAGGANVNDIRAVTQALFDRMQVTAPNTVIEGRPGSLPAKAPAAVFTIDSIPLDAFYMTAYVQNGREFARVATDSRGALPMGKYKVPFVHNGSMLSINPDARAYIKSDDFIRYRDLGIRLTKGQELTYIFKVPTLTYTLDYKVFTQEPDIKIPPEFVSDAHVRKYLKDICGLVPASSGASPDLTIRIGAQVSKHTYNETEEDGFKMTMRAEFRGAGIDKVHNDVFEKRQRFGLSLQTGTYFWEASGAIREFIINTLAKD